MGKPHASIRKYICWDRQNGGQESEPTSTLVITTSRGYYVDIRILKDQATDTESLSSIDWAFAGQSTVLQPGTAGDGCTTVQWAHEIDSRHVGREDVGALPKDVGRLFPTRADGDTLETGRMEHPETGVDTDYEELWAGVDLVAVPGCLLGGGAGKVSVVLRHARRAPVVSRGMVVRLGQFVQGILVEDGELALERWEYDGAGFRCAVRVGHRGLLMPCEHLFGRDGASLGMPFDSHGRTWEVIEKEVWT